MMQRLLLSISFISVLFVANGCGVKSFKLSDGKTRVPYGRSVFEERAAVNQAAFLQVDTSCLYWRIDTSENAVVSIYKFYGNGLLNLFVFRAEELPSLSTRINPELSGYRGIYFMHDGKIKGKLFVPQNGLGELGLLKRTFSFAKDNMYETGPLSAYPTVYVKRSLPAEATYYQPEW